MLDKRYLQYGIDALSRAHSMNYFTDGHRGAAIIAAYFFCHEVDNEPGVSDRLSALIGTQWAASPLCAPYPLEPMDADGIPRILEAIEESMDFLRQAGHNVILPTMALRAFMERPELVTPSRVAGICSLIKAFTVNEPHVLEDDDVEIDMRHPANAADFILNELLSTMQAFQGRGQGWSGHLLTYGRALLDLINMGYMQTAECGQHAFNLYIKRLRMGPLETDIARPEHPVNNLRPHQCAYWDQRMHKPLNLGHSIKYPYGFYGLAAVAGDRDLVAQCFNEAYHIF